MKILSLRLSNLASIAGEQHIDFEQEPLKSAGLIAITGITGAGKTTLLDAICLALFDQVPRLQHAEANKKMVDASGEDIQVNSTVNILRRGCVQGFAEVEFIAQDYKHYLARWEVKRARLKANGRIQPVLRTLRCITDDQLISERSKECNERIIKLLGLDFNQFTRAVLLAQSEVTAFLKAKDNERADLLEYLTNSDIYSRIGIASFAATKQAREKVESIENKMGDQQPLSEEERQLLTEQLQTTQQQLEKLKLEQQQHQKQVDWYTQQQQLEQQINQQKLQLSSAQQQLDSFEPHVILLKQLEQFEPIRASFIQNQQLKNSQSDLLIAQQLCQQDVAATKQAFEQQQQDHQHQLETLNALLQQHQLLKPQLHTASQCEHTLASLNDQIKQQQNKLEQLNNQLSPKLAQQIELQQQLNSLNTKQIQQQEILQQTQDFLIFDAEPQAAISSLQKAAKLRSSIQNQQADIFNRNLAMQQQQLENSQQQLNHLNKQHGSIETYEQQLQQTFAELNKQDKHLSSCERIGDQLKQWHKLEQLIASQQQQQSVEQQQLEPLKLLVQDAQQQTQQAEIQLKTTQQLAREQRLLTAQSAKDLRAQLKPQHPCMVCGSTEHPFFDPQNLLNALNQQLDKQEQQAEQVLNQAREQALKHQNNLTKLQSSLDQLSNNQKQSQKDKQSILDEIKHISPGFYERLESNINLPAAEQLLKELHQKVEDKKTDLSEQHQQQQTQLKAWQQLDKQCEQQRSLLEKRQELLNLEQQSIMQLNSTLNEQWQQDCNAAHLVFVQKIQLRTNALQQLKQLDQQAVESQQQLLQLQSSIAHEQKQLTEEQQQLKNQQAQQQQTQQQLTDLFTQFATPLMVKSSADWQQQLEQQAQQAQQQLNQIDQKKQLSEKEYIKQQQRLEHLQQNIVKNDSLLLETQQHIEQWQQIELNNHLQASDIEKLLQCDHAYKKQLQDQQQDLQQKLQQATNTLSVYEQQNQQHLINKPALELEALSNRLNELNEAAKHIDEECTALKVKKLQDEQQQAQAMQFVAQLEKAKLEHHRWDKISSLIGDSKGATFKKLAQQFHLQMLVELANQQLEALTPRYELRCIEDSLGLTIVDHFMNDEVRPVLSLSGGESFLVSLALALGIANMASGTTKLESLFIDEGFGTLDQSSLHIVMDALDRLQSQGRKVILISHIADMHERIPVKIQVIPQGSGASTIEVIG